MSGSTTCTHPTCASTSTSFANSEVLKTHRRTQHIPKPKQHEFGYQMMCPAYFIGRCSFRRVRDLWHIMEGHVRDEHGDKSYFDDLAEVLNPKHEDEEGRDLKEVQRLCDEWLAEHPDEWVNNAEGLVRQRLGASRESPDTSSSGGL